MISKKSNSITIKDIAKALNLSPSSVTRALQDSYKISEATRIKVKEYALEHNYHPNLIAQSLRNKQSRSLGVILCSIPNSFFAEVISGVESIANENNYHVMISQSLESYKNEIEEVEHFERKSVDGLLVSISAETEDFTHFQRIIDSGVPVVFFDRVPGNILAHKVVAQNSEGSALLTEHLVEQGFKKIAHITSSPQLSITKERLNGYFEVLEKHQVNLSPGYIKYCTHGGKDEDEIYKAVDELLQLPEPPDAIVTASDRITLKTFAFLKDKGIKIPAEIALAGFSNFSEPQLFCPSLTTISQPAFQIGRKSAELLIHTMESKRPLKNFETVSLPVELNIRQSSIRLKR
jgi:LacI family transcriptional regulator